jgi:phosphatidylglycerol:prolipoprotein diacylglycerol transferase
MSETDPRFQARTGIEPYWPLIALFLILAAALYIYHLATGQTPDRAAFSIPIVELDVYWYGVWIVSGVALGGFVVSRLALRRARACFAAVVPAAVQQVPVASLALPEEIHRILHDNGIETVGELLFTAGLDRRNAGLSEAGAAEVASALRQIPDYESDWLEEAPWRIWNPEHVWNGLLVALILGVIGARLYHVLTPSPSMAAVGIESPLDYFRNPYLIFDLRRGGLGIYGGLAGGALGVWWYARRQGIPALAWADMAVIGLALGQAIGRWGNFFNQELYGRPTAVPWAITIEPRYRLPAYSEFATFHPAFLYESLWSLLTFALLLFLFRRRRQRLLDGDLMALYLIAYAIGRTLLEQVRLDSRAVTLGPLSIQMAVATLVSLLAAAMAAWLLWRRRRIRED